MVGPSNSTGRSNPANSARISPPRVLTRPARSSASDGRSAARFWKSAAPAFPAERWPASGTCPTWCAASPQAGRPGAYLRIVTEGDVGAGDRIEVIHRPAHGVTLRETFRALTGDRRLAHRLLEAPELPAAARARAYIWLADAAADRAGPRES